MPERQPTTGQLRLIRDLHVDRKLTGMTAEQAAPILTEVGLLTPKLLQHATGIRRDADGVLLGDGRQLAFRLSRSDGVDRDLITSAYARLAERLNVEFTAPTSYQAADRQIARLKTIVRDQAQASSGPIHGIEPADRDIIADVQRETNEAERARASYAPDTVENTPSRPDAEQAGAGASWGSGHQMARQHAATRASAKQIQLLDSLAAMAGVEVEPAETTQDVGSQIDSIIESMTAQIHEIQKFLQVEVTDTEKLKPWVLGGLLTDSKVAAMNELRTLEQMEGVAEPATPTSWAEARERIGELRESQNLGSDSLYTLRMQTDVPFHHGPHIPEQGPTVDQPFLRAAPPSSGMTYAGIGWRRTPGPTLNAMRATAERLSTIGYTVRSGHAPGADTAFEVASQNSEIYLPWPSFENNRPIVGNYIQHHSTEAAMRLAARIHPAWERLDQGPRALHARNMHQILGRDLQTPVDFVVCYTPDGSLTGHGADTGGTATALRLAYRNNIPIINLKNPEHAATLASYLQENVPDRRLQHCRGWLEHHLPASEQQLTELRDLQVDERLSRMLPSQALAAITTTPLRDIADATTDFPFHYDEHGNQTGTGLDLMRWYAERPRANVARRAAYNELARRWSLGESVPETAELTRMKITQMREKVWGSHFVAPVIDAHPDVGVGVS